MSVLENKLVGSIDEAYAMEQHVLRMLDVMIATTDDAQLKRALERHRKETVRHAERLEGCLGAHGATPSRVKQAGSLIGAVTKGIVDISRGDKSARHARDAFATEHMEIATYELLERVAKKAGDKQTAAVARENRAEEEAMARSISSKWNKIAELSLEEAGVRASRPGTTTRAKAAPAKAKAAPARAKAAPARAKAAPARTKAATSRTATPNSKGATGTRATASTRRRTGTRPA